VYGHEDDSPSEWREPCTNLDYLKERFKDRIQFGDFIENFTWDELLYDEKVLFREGTR